MYRRHSPGSVATGGDVQPGVSPTAPVIGGHAVTPEASQYALHSPSMHNTHNNIASPKMTPQIPQTKTSVLRQFRKPTDCSGDSGSKHVHTPSQFVGPSKSEDFTQDYPKIQPNQNNCVTNSDSNISEQQNNSVYPIYGTQNIPNRTYYPENSVKSTSPCFDNFHRPIVSQNNVSYWSSNASNALTHMSESYMDSKSNYNNVIKTSQDYRYNYCSQQKKSPVTDSNYYIPKNCDTRSSPIQNYSNQIDRRISPVQNFAPPKPEYTNYLEKSNDRLDMNYQKNNLDVRYPQYVPQSNYLPPKPINTVPKKNSFTILEQRLTNQNYNEVSEYMYAKYPQIIQTKGNPSQRLSNQTFLPQPIQKPVQNLDQNKYTDWPYPPELRNNRYFAQVAQLDPSIAQGIVRSHNVLKNYELPRDRLLENARMPYQNKMLRYPDSNFQNNIRPVRPMTANYIPEMPRPIEDPNKFVRKMDFTSSCKVDNYRAENGLRPEEMYLNPQLRNSYPLPIHRTSVENPPRNISPRSTFQENMHTIVIPPQGIQSFSQNDYYNQNYYNKDLYNVPVQYSEYQRNQNLPRPYIQQRLPYAENYIQQDFNQRCSQFSDKERIIDDESRKSYNTSRDSEVSKLNLKEFFENWEDDEEIVANLPDLIPSNISERNMSVESNYVSENSNDKGSFTDDGKNVENLLTNHPIYILEKQNISAEMLCKYPHLTPVDRLPENVKFLKAPTSPKDTVKKIVNDQALNLTLAKTNEVEVNNTEENNNSVCLEVPTKEEKMIDQAAKKEHKSVIVSNIQFDGEKDVKEINLDVEKSSAAKQNIAIKPEDNAFSLNILPDSSYDMDNINMLSEYVNNKTSIDLTDEPPENIEETEKESLETKEKEVFESTCEEKFKEINTGTEDGENSPDGTIAENMDELISNTKEIDNNSDTSIDDTVNLNTKNIDKHINSNAQATEKVELPFVNDIDGLDTKNIISSEQIKDDSSKKYNEKNDAQEQNTQEIISAEQNKEEVSEKCNEESKNFLQDLTTQEIVTMVQNKKILHKECCERSETVQEDLSTEEIISKNQNNREFSKICNEEDENVQSNSNISEMVSVEQNNDTISEKCNEEEENVQELNAQNIISTERNEEELSEECHENVLEDSSSQEVKITEQIKEVLSNNYSKESKSVEENINTQEIITDQSKELFNESKMEECEHFIQETSCNSESSSFYSISDEEFEENEGVLPTLSKNTDNECECSSLNTHENIENSESHNQIQFNLDKLKEIGSVFDDRSHKQEEIKCQDKAASVNDSSPNEIMRTYRTQNENKEKCLKKENISTSLEESLVDSSAEVNLVGENLLHSDDEYISKTEILEKSEETKKSNNIDENENKKIDEACCIGKSCMSEKQREMNVEQNSVEVEIMNKNRVYQVASTSTTLEEIVEKTYSIPVVHAISEDISSNEDSTNTEICLVQKEKVVSQEKESEVSTNTPKIEYVNDSSKIEIQKTFANSFVPAQTKLMVDFSVQTNLDFSPSYDINIFPKRRPKFKNVPRKKKRDKLKSINKKVRFKKQILLKKRKQRRKEVRKIMMEKSSSSLKFKIKEEIVIIEDEEETIDRFINPENPDRDNLEIVQPCNAVSEIKDFNTDNFNELRDNILDQPFIELVGQNNEQELLNDEKLGYLTDGLHLNLPSRKLLDLSEKPDAALDSVTDNILIKLPSASESETALLRRSESYEDNSKTLTDELITIPLKRRSIDRGRKHFIPIDEISKNVLEALNTLSDTSDSRKSLDSSFEDKPELSQGSSDCIYATTACKHDAENTTWEKETNGEVMAEAITIVGSVIKHTNVEVLDPNEERINSFPLDLSKKDLKEETKTFDCTSDSNGIKTMIENTKISIELLMSNSKVKSDNEEKKTDDDDNVKHEKLVKIIPNLLKQNPGGEEEAYSEIKNNSDYTPEETDGPNMESIPNSNDMTNYDFDNGIFRSSTPSSEDNYAQYVIETNGDTYQDILLSSESTGLAAASDEGSSDVLKEKIQEEQPTILETPGNPEILDIEDGVENIFKEVIIDDSKSEDDVGNIEENLLENEDPLALNENDLSSTLELNTATKEEGIISFSPVSNGTICRPESIVKPNLIDADMSSSDSSELEFRKHNFYSNIARRYIHPCNNLESQNNINKINSDIHRKPRKINLSDYRKRKISVVLEDIVNTPNITSDTNSISDDNIMDGFLKEEVTSCKKANIPLNKTVILKNEVTVPRKEVIILNKDVVIPRFEPIIQNSEDRLSNKDEIVASSSGSSEHKLENLDKNRSQKRMTDNSKSNKLSKINDNLSLDISYKEVPVKKMEKPVVKDNKSVKKNGLNCNTLQQKEILHGILKHKIDTSPVSGIFTSQTLGNGALKFKKSFVNIAKENKVSEKNRDASKSISKKSSKEIKRKHILEIQSAENTLFIDPLILKRRPSVEEQKNGAKKIKQELKNTNISIPGPSRISSEGETRKKSDSKDKEEKRKLALDTDRPKKHIFEIHKPKTDIKEQPKNELNGTKENQTTRKHRKRKKRRFRNLYTISDSDDDIPSPKLTETGGIKVKIPRDCYDKAKKNFKSIAVQQSSSCKSTDVVPKVIIKKNGTTYVSSFLKHIKQPFWQPRVMLKRYPSSEILEITRRASS